MKRLTTASLFAFALSAGMLPALSGAALADTKVYPALTICRNGAVNNGSLVNGGFTAPVTVICAVPRDRTNLAPTSIQVSVVDNSSLLIGDGNFSCSATAYSRFGVQGATGVSASSTGVNSAGTILSLGIPAMAVEGYFLVNCKVPRRGTGDPVSRISSIRVVEPDPTN